MDPNFKEKERLEGLGDAPPGYSRMMKTRVGDDDNYMIWMRGKHEISIVNTYDFSARHINNFWNYRGRDVNAVAAAIDPEASRLVGIGFMPGAGEVQTIHVYDGGDGVSIFEGYDILPEGTINFLNNSSRSLALLRGQCTRGCLLFGWSRGKEIRIRRCLLGCNVLR